jgi:hypothetical protein
MSISIICRRLRFRGGTVKAIPLTSETAALARRVIWFEEPSAALSDPVRFAAYAFARATHEDMSVLRCFLSDDDLREALDRAPPGIIDPCSWAFWNAKLGRYPAPPMPVRRFG